MQKYCSKCGLSKNIGEFHKNRTTKDGYQHYCKQCKDQYRYPEKHKEYYQKNRAKIAAYVKKRQQVTHRDRYLEYQKEYHKKLYEENREEILDYHRERYKRDRDKITARNERWRKANPKMLVIKAARRRGRKAQAEGTFTKQDIDNLYTQQSGKCFYCGKELNGKFDIDHKTPLSRGGSNWPKNLCCACKSCNSSKRDKTVEEFLRLITKEKAVELS